MREPDYLYFGGNGIPPPPYKFTGATLWSLLLFGDHACITSFLDRTLNAATIAGRFVPALGNVIWLLQIKAKALTSTVAPYDGFGTMAETDIGLWLTVRDTVTNQLYLYPAYLFVDNWLALAAGREVYGFPKTFADIDAQTAMLAVTTLAVKNYAPDAVWVPSMLFQLSPLPDQAAPILTGGGLSLTRGAASLMNQQANDPALSEKLRTALRQAASLLPGLGGFALLRQFRDPASSVSASERCLFSVMPKIGVPSAIGSFTQRSCRFTLNEYASQPVAADLGLVIGAQECWPILWTDLDFTLPLGAAISD
ncbi:MAG TPA: acetoacetate decarboxylase family protein [Acidiphilium sp.]|nr:MAG: hypothetical protein B7Z57_13540 [Acidiphilium sp. 37-60-79]OZB38352.1 MAG: hypothetical protein B7X48_13525 [Acidiphilium sp. 34-60-192]HQT89842.1 acetoacetate decarboxylase family protein [Acidiphilium sp.]HQU25162.1 acetoacetate decarboxylase family protein [Acidiphilium sp.]